MESTLRIEYEPIESAKLAVGNPKSHDLPLIKASIQRWGFAELAVVNEKTGRLVAGHGRREALVELQRSGAPLPGNIRQDEQGRWLWPVVRGVSFRNQAEADGYLVAVNRSVMAGGWDADRLAKLLDGVRAKTDLVGTGFTSKELDRMLSKAKVSAVEQQGEPDAGELPTEPISKAGDLWLLGDHRLVCGDCRDSTVMARLMDGDLADELFADPPYGMGKEKDGIVGDNQYGPKLDQFQSEWWRAVRPHLKSTAAAYIWGNAPDLWRWWFGWLSLSETLTFRNEIVWYKGDYANGQRTAVALQYPVLSERALFFVLGNQAAGARNQARYWQGWEPIRSYLAEEAKAGGLNAGRVKELTGAGMWQHWFSKSQWLFLPEDAYQALRAATGRFERSYAALSAQYEALRFEFEKLQTAERAYHDNTHEKMGDVWEFPRLVGAERHGHATPKPVALAKRALLTSCPPGGVAVSPFGGTGPELLAAEQTGRRARLVELQPAYVDVVIERWQRLTGGKAKRG
jgi:DNA modification methylase